MRYLVVGLYAIGAIAIATQTTRAMLTSKGFLSFAGFAVGMVVQVLWIAFCFGLLLWVSPW